MKYFPGTHPPQSCYKWTDFIIKSVFLMKNGLFPSVKKYLGRHLFSAAWGKLSMCNPSRSNFPQFGPVMIWPFAWQWNRIIEHDIHLEIISLTIYSIGWNLCIVHPILLLVVILWYLILNHQYSNFESSKYSIFRIYSNLWTVRWYPTSDRSVSMYILM